MSERVTLGDVIEIASGQVDPRKEPYCNRLHVGGDNIESGSGRLYGLRTAKVLNLISGKYEFGPNDVLYSKIRPALNKVALPDFGGVCSADMYPLKPFVNRLERRYLAYLLRQDDFLAYAGRHSSRTNIPKINRDALLAYEFQLPALPEQRRVANILDKADAIRRKRKEAITFAEELLRSAFLDMFGDPVANPKGWEVKPLGSLLSFLTSGSRGWAQHYADEGDLFLRIQNVQGDRLELEDVAYVRAPDTAEAKRTLVEPNDVLLSITADLGRTCVIPPGLGKAFVNQHLAILRPANIDAEYLSAFLASTAGQLQFSRLNRHGVKAGLNFDDIRSVQIVLPPRNLQHTFAAIKTRVRNLQALQNSGINDAQKLFQVLVHRLF